VVLLVLLVRPVLLVLLAPRDLKARRALLDLLERTVLLVPRVPLAHRVPRVRPALLAQLLALEVVPVWVLAGLRDRWVPRALLDPADL